MALAVDGSGTVFKKCDRSSHRPDSNKGCASSTCQHTCDNPERCAHAWTLRYWVNGKQVEKSFKDVTHPTAGRVNYGSGRRLAQDWQLKTSVDKRSGDITFADHGKSGKQNFGEACEAWSSRQQVGENSRYHYLSAYRAYVQPVFGAMTLAQVARDRDAVTELLTVTMKHLSNTPRQQARLVIVGTCDEAVKAGRLSRHNLADIELTDHGPKKLGSDFVFPSYEQVKFVADGGVNPGTKRVVGGAGLSVWLMRGCGLRIEEALAVGKEDFIEDGAVLRVMWQASGDGKQREPLKHRKPGEYRDVPVPSWLWEMVRDMPDGPLIPGNGKLFQRYGTIYFRCMRAAEVAGIADGFTPHSLRHLRVYQLRPWGADHRACPLPWTPGHQRHAPGVRASAAVRCQARSGGAGRRVCRMERGLAFCLTLLDEGSPALNGLDEFLALEDVYGPDDCVPGDAVLLCETVEGRYGSTLGEPTCRDVGFDVGGDPQVRRKHLAGLLVGHSKTVLTLGSHVRKLQLAITVLLEEPDDLNGALETELRLFRDKLHVLELEYAIG